MELLSIGPAPGADADARDQAASRREELTRSHEAAMASLLGATTYAQWKDYQETAGVRVQISQLDTVLQSTAQPLSSVQRRQMIAALASYQKQLNLDSLPAVSGSSGDRAATTIEGHLQREEEQNQKLRGVAASYLSPEQLDAFEKMHSQASALSRAMLGSQRPTGTD